MTEKQVRDKIVDYLESIGAYVFVKHQTIHGRKGVPDLICCLDGRFLGVEVKDGTNKPTVHQQNEIANILSSGGMALVAWSVNDVKAYLDGVE